MLVSMWPIDDRASGTLIEDFYGELHNRASLPEALRRAKLSLLDETSNGDRPLWGLSPPPGCVYCRL